MHPRFHLLAAVVCSTPLAGADVQLTLFDGKSLSGWTAVHDAKFSVAGGVLRLDGGMGWLRTDQRFRDFTLQLEWRALGPKYDSGIYFRAPLAGKPWPPRYQVNLRHDEVGKLVGVEGAGGPTPASVKPHGEWNRFDLRVAGKEASLAVNGVEAWKTQALEEGDGFIGIQAEEHKFEIRNVAVIEHGYIDLLEGFERQSGKHLTARGESQWTVKDGVLLAGGGSGWLGTNTGDWADFSLKLDYQLPADGQSGVFLRCPLEGNPSYEGLEVQLIDDDTVKWQVKNEQRTGAVYGALAPVRRATRAAGTWEAAEITARGARLEVRINGHVVLDADLDQAVAPLSEAKSLKDRPRRGHLGLQGHGDGARFRGLRVRRT